MAEMANPAAGDSSQMLELIEELQTEVGAARPLAGARSVADGLLNVLGRHGADRWSVGAGA